MSIHRIAMLSVHTCPLAMLGGKKTGGMNVYVRDFSRELGRQDVQVDVFTRSQDTSSLFISRDLGFGGRVIHIHAGPEEPIPVIDVADHLDTFADGVLAFAESESIQYDIIHSHYWLSGLVAEKLQERWEKDGRYIPIVHMFHTLGHMKNQIANDDSQRASQRRLDGENHVIAAVDRIIGATPAEEAQLHWLYKGINMGKVSIIPPGVDLTRFAPIDKTVAKEHVGIPSHHKNLIFAGRIEPLKGIDTLLKAICLIRGRHPRLVDDVCVAIIGGDPWATCPDAEMARLQQMRHDLGIGDLVTFIGAKDQEILPYYYAAAEAVIMPSHYESFGMVALEAMAMGTPVIASEVGGLAFLVKDGRNGYLVPSRNPEALAERIYELLTNQTCHWELSRYARENAQQYNWKNIVAQMLLVYEELIGN